MIKQYLYFKYWDPSEQLQHKCVKKKIKLHAVYKAECSWIIVKLY